MLETQIRGLQQLQAKADQVIEDLHGRPMLDGMRKATVAVVNEAKQLVPVDRGQLHASITPEVRTAGQDVIGVVGSNLLYAPYQETGTRPFWPPISALEVWARRHGVSAYVIARAISRHGIKPKRYLQRAVEAKRREVQTIIDRAVKGIVDQ